MQPCNSTAPLQERSMTGRRRTLCAGREGVSRADGPCGWRVYRRAGSVRLAIGAAAAVWSPQMVHEPSVQRLSGVGW